MKLGGVDMAYGHGCGLDNSDLPCFFLWPERTELGKFRVVDCETCDYHTLGEIENIATLGPGALLCCLRPQGVA